MRRASSLGLFLVVLANVVPLLLVERVPTQDGPSHVAAAAVMASPDDFPLYEVDRSPLPNVAVHWTTAALLRVGLSGPAADRLLLVLLVLALPAALAYAARSAWVAPAALPLGGSWFLWMGFTNFLWGVVVLLVAVGWWRRRRGLVGLAVLLLVAAACHLVALLAALVLVLAADGRRAVSAGVAALPALGVVALTATTGPGGARWTAPLTVARRALSLAYPVRTFAGWEEWLGIALSLAVGVALVVQRRRRDDVALVVGALGLLVAATILPSAIGEASFVPDRLTLVAALGLLVWLGSGPVVPAAVAVFVAVGIAAPLLRLPDVVDADDEVAAFVSLAAEVPEGAHLLPLLVVDEWDDGRSPRPLAHAAGWLTADDRHVVDLSHYEATLPYFPARFRDDVDPAGRLFAGPLQAIPPDVRIASYEEATGVRVDAVLTWGPPPASLVDQLGPFRRVASGGRGALWLRAR